MADQGLEEQNKEILEKVWGEKKDQFSGRQKGEFFPRVEKRSCHRNQEIPCVVVPWFLGPCLLFFLLITIIKKETNSAATFTQETIAKTKRFFI